MNQIADFGAVSRVSVTVLVDNRADMIVRSTDDVVYFTDKPLLAEHGYAALVDLVDVGIRILWDAGGSRYGGDHRVEPRTLGSHRCDCRGP